VNKLTDTLGAEVVGLDTDRILGDAALPGEIWAALEDHGVLVFRRLNLEPRDQAALCQRLALADTSDDHPLKIDASDSDLEGAEGVHRLGFSKNPGADYIAGTFNWHFDGCRYPPGQPIEKAIMLTPLAVNGDAGTEFASSYHGYNLLTAQEKERFENVRVFYSHATVEAKMTPTPEQKADHFGKTGKEGPLVWRHRSGRRSLVLGVTAQYVLGMDLASGQRILEDLLQRTTAPEVVYRHEWSLGDTVIWNNHGVLHHALPYEPGSPRVMLRSSLIGGELLWE
jgi:alpha-ketoglutarate-dependent taurine dioxygenase